MKLIENFLLLKTKLQFQVIDKQLTVLNSYRFLTAA